MRDLVVGDIAAARSPQDVLDIHVLNLARAFRQCPVADHQIVAPRRLFGQLMEIGLSHLVQRRAPNALQVLQDQIHDRRQVINGVTGKRVYILNDLVLSAVPGADFRDVPVTEVAEQHL